MFEICKTELNDDVEKVLLLLSQNWESENNCFGYVANSAASFKNKDIFIVKDKNQTVGYLLCRRYIQENDTATVNKGSNCLEIDEIYILPNYRNKGLGKRLFNTAIKYYDKTIDYVTLSTATKNYKAILHFYIEELGMTFWCANLFKKL